MFTQGPFPNERPSSDAKGSLVPTSPTWSDGCKKAATTPACSGGKFEIRGLRKDIKSSIPDLRTFAEGLQREYSALKAALTYPYSTGPVEGQINRLKLIKRSMYGRGSFELLSQRVLIAA